MMETTLSNALLSNARPSDTSPQVQLHPLVLLTISDYTTRHALRKQEGPIVGAILGQQNGREITMEVAFECNLIAGPNGEALLHDSWFKDRLEAFKEVYKSPQLDLVGWFALGKPTGPEQHHLPIHQQLSEAYSDCPNILLLFHPTAVIEGNMTGGRLPLTLYEGEPDQNTLWKFHELAYSVETGEAEMISVDFVARGGGNATAVDGTKQAPTQAQSPAETKGKGKAKEGDAQVNGTVADDTSYLSPEDDELISSLTAKLNATRMLHQRINLLAAYLSSLPPSYLTDASLSTIPPNIDPQASQAPIDHSILRSIRALLSRLPLLPPPETAAFARESLEQRADVGLISLLSSITSSVHDAKELGRKSALVELRRTVTKRDRMGGSGGMQAEGPDVPYASPTGVAGMGGGF